MDAIQVLLIEDNPADALLVREALSEPGRARFAVNHAGRLSEGLADLEAHPVDVVLLDLGLPDSRGIDTFRAVQHRTSSVPIVVLSHLDDESVAVKALQEGAQDYLLKGRIEHDVLSRGLRFAIERKRSDELLRQSAERIARQARELELEINERRFAQDALGERARLASFTAEITLAMTRDQPIAETLRRCAEITVGRLGAAFARIWTLDEATSVLELQASAGMYTHLNGPHSRVPVGKFKIGLIAAERTPHLTNDVVGDPRVSNQEWARREGMVAFAGYPLIVAERLIGVLAMFARHPISSSTLDAMASVADVVAVGIERKRAEGELRLLRKAVEASEEVVLLTDPQGIITFVNPAFSHVYGYDREEVVGRVTPRILKSGEMAEEWYRAFWRRLMDKQVVREELVNRRKDGGLVTVEASVNPVLDDRGEIAGFLGIQRDVTDRKHVVGQLRESEERYRTLAEAARDHIFIIDRELRVQYLNRIGAAAHGLSAEEVVGKHLAELFPSPSKEQIRLELEQVFASGEPLYAENRLAFPEGERWSGAWLVPIKGETGEVKAVMGVSRDLTERKLLEQQFRQSQKMEAIGRLAGGVAHDFNNLLGVILGYGEMLQHRLEKEPVGRNQAEQVVKAAERAAGLTRQLLAFSRKQVLEPRILDLNAVVTDMEKMLLRLIGEDVELGKSLAAGLGSVKIDPGQLEQVIMNLVVNSRDAMPRGGTLIIETANTELSDVTPRPETVVHAGPYVLLAVSDTGCGMDEETRSRIFEPFFTTKEAGKGTGLGLATVYGIVKQSNGYIWAYSEPGQGTTFKIYLPRVDQGVEEPRPARATVARGSETVMIVEDHAALRELARVFLAGWGYTVLEATSPKEALEMARRHAGTIHLLLTDVVMPGMSGRALAEEMASVHPEARVLYMSGYTADAITVHGVLKDGTFFLAKPFNQEALVRKVREVLDSDRTG